jgi:DNA-directed RNA polymerase beta' subunit
MTTTILNSIPIKEIDSIIFGLFSEKEIKSNSVCKITSTKLIGENTVYDERMGTIEAGTHCKSCNLDCKSCVGHIGYIELVNPILHPMYYRYIINILKCICFTCKRFILTPDHVELIGIKPHLRGESRFNKLLEKIEKIDCCYNCEKSKVKISFSVNEGVIYKYHKKTKIPIKEEEIKYIFDNISDEDVYQMGFDPLLIHPRNLIITLLPVLPPISRPYIITEGILCDDDLTKQYIEIVKTNNNLAMEDLNEVKKTKYIQTLKFRIKTLMNNSQSKSRHSNGRPLKGIKERLTGKEGLIRNNLLGKRCNQTARTVIGPDPTLRTDEMAIPEKIAKNLTVPERVNNINIEYLTRLVNEGKANYILKNNEETRINIKYAMYKKQSEIRYEDKVFRNDIEIDHNYRGFVLKEGDHIMRNGEKIENLDISVKKHISLQVGDVVERQLRNGDIVLLNRQPTLHKSSMLAKKIVVRPGKTFRFNLASCKTFNADFDGDEMNIHVPQQPDAIAELQELSTTKVNIMGPQASKTNLSIVQDTLLGSYLMTKSKEIMPKEKFFQICMRGDEWSTDFILKKIDFIKSVLEELKLPCEEKDIFTGKNLISMMLPNDFVYVKKNDSTKSEPIVKIYKGVMYEGVLNKANLGSAHGSILQVLLKDYNSDICIGFINNIQFITCEWLLYEGFSIGIEDCITNKQDEIKSSVFKSYFQSKKIEESVSNPVIREAKITVALNKAKDFGMKIAKENMSEDNCFISTVMSGSKGDFFNITQITGLVGQQNITGKRVQATFNKGKRTLPHYRYDLSDNIECEFESKGFIRHSFMQGINPKEFWYHAMSGREGVSDTAMKTALSGYVQRKMVKVMEDVQIRYDGTVRNSQGSIIQWAYGDDGLDRTCTVVNKDGESEFCDVSRIVDRLNVNFEHIVKNQKNPKV